MLIHPLQPRDYLLPSTTSTRPPLISTTTRLPPSSTQRPSASTSSALPPFKRASSKTTTLRRQREASPPPPPPPPPPADTKPRTDKAKLTELWGLPPVNIRQDNGTILLRGDLLGEGGFARVYLATEEDGRLKAVKVIAKEQLKSTKNKGKLFGEIKIHQAMKHLNIIEFEHCFEDDGHVYMKLELCPHGSLLDLLRRRRRYSEPEARFYLVQLIGACEYMHNNSVIHRDLKLGNLMLDEHMNLRVGDFGLAALVKFPGERKKTICGTPNYIAPEILFDTTNGHSFEVDVWSIGVILYTLLVGKPPFQTKDVKNIYRKIKDNNYEWPADIELSVEAVDLVSAILTTLPEQRPTLAEILTHSWFLSGPFPPSIAPSSLTAIPDYRQMSIRASHRNFRTVKKQCGIVDIEITAASTIPPTVRAPLQAVFEDEEQEVFVAASALAATLPATVTEARGMEKEVRQVLQPGSPISDLLRSARKPLMVSPHAEPRELLQRKLLAEARAGVGAGPPPPFAVGQLKSGTATSATLSRTENGGSSAKENDGSRARARGTTTTGTTMSPNRNGNLVVGGTKTKEALAKSVTTNYPARELYEATWRTLDNALSVSTTAALDALPDPSPQPPRVFITSWVDYTHKYGTAYSLTDGSSGLYYNDSTTMVLSPDKVHLDYISNWKGNIYSRRHHDVEVHPKDVERKVYLLKYFDEYMSQTLKREVEWTFSDVGRTKNMDFLVKYYRMKNAIVFKMSNEVLQFNFYDHTKLLLTQNGTVITFIDGDFNLRSYSLATLFHEAHHLGYYHSKPQVELDPKRAKRLDLTKLVISKLEYCRDVLRTLSTRKLSASTTTSRTTLTSSTTLRGLVH